MPVSAHTKLSVIVPRRFHKIVATNTLIFKRLKSASPRAWLGLGVGVGGGSGVWGCGGEEWAPSWNCCPALV